MRIGTWFDNKPLYRKVLTTTQTISPYENDNKILTIPHNISNVDTIFITTAYLIQTSSGLSIPMLQNNSPFYSSSKDYYVSIDIDKNNCSIMCKGGGWNTDWLKVIVVNYTKTTD